MMMMSGYSEFKNPPVNTQLIILKQHFLIKQNTFRMLVTYLLLVSGFHEVIFTFHRLISQSTQE